jgi:hypothetical protein
LLHYKNILIPIRRDFFILDKFKSAIMKKIVIFFCVLFTSISFSQVSLKYHTISLRDKNDLPIGLDFYIEKVYDGRQFKENIGTVQKGAFNTKVLSNFEKPFTDELYDYLSIVCPKQENKKKIAIRINDLYVSELTRSFSETGYATIVLDIIEQRNDVNYSVGTFSSTIESNGMDVTNKHDERLKEVLQNCLSEYIKTEEKNKTLMLFDPNQHANRTISATPLKGIYLTYNDVLNNKPLDDSNFSVSDKNDKYILINNTTKLKELNYYGFSDGQNFFINVSKYARDRYYAKTDIIGNKYYIENVLYNPNNAIAMVAMFGLIGVAIASAASDSSVPMLIDCYSGQPSFLSNSEIKAMLLPYPALLKEYKNSNKNNQDKKYILKKYFDQSLK